MIKRLIAELIAARHAQGLTQAALAEDMGIDKGLLGRWEAGRTVPSLRSLERWAYSLGYQFALIPRTGGGA